MAFKYYKGLIIDWQHEHSPIYFKCREKIVCIKAESEKEAASHLEHLAKPQDIIGTVKTVCIGETFDPKEYCEIKA